MAGRRSRLPGGALGDAPGPAFACPQHGLFCGAGLQQFTEGGWVDQRRWLAERGNAPPKLADYGLCRFVSGAGWRRFGGGPGKVWPNGDGADFGSAKYYAALR